MADVRVDILSFLKVSSPDPPGMLMSSTIASTGGVRIACNGVIFSDEDAHALRRSRGSNVIVC